PKTNQKFASFVFRSWSNNGATEQKFRDGSSPLRHLIQIPANGFRGTRGDALQVLWPTFTNVGRVSVSFTQHGLKRNAVPDVGLGQK
ncbi:MAG: hypothetical protein WCD29_12160, partial [Pseudolabrys sp.]